MLQVFQDSNRIDSGPNQTGAYALAVEKGYPAKAEVLKTFILDETEVDNGAQINSRRPARHIAKHLDRARASKIDRPYKSTTNRMPNPETTTLYQNQYDAEVIS
jgi:hypothetical protein